jgi:hypothetical protein
MPRFSATAKLQQNSSELKVSSLKSQNHDINKKNPTMQIHHGILS